MRELDPLDYFATLTRAPGVHLVVFVKSGCGACRAMLAALRAGPPPGVVVHVVDGDAGPGLIADYEIEHFPALFVWRDREYHAAIAAPPRPAALREAIAAALARPAEPEP